MCLRIWPCNFLKHTSIYVLYFNFQLPRNLEDFSLFAERFCQAVLTWYYDYLLRLCGILCKICLGPQPFRMHWVNLRWSSWPSLAFWEILGTSSAQEGIWKASGFSPGFSYCDCHFFPPGTRPATRLPPTKKKKSSTVELQLKRKALGFFPHCRNF